MPPDGLDLDQAYQVQPVTEELADVIVLMAQERDRAVAQRDSARRWAVHLEQLCAAARNEIKSGHLFAALTILEGHTL